MSISERELLGQHRTAFTQRAPESTEFGELTQIKGHYDVQGHLKSPILCQLETNIRLLLVINARLPHISHRFRDLAFDRSKL